MKKKNTVQYNGEDLPEETKTDWQRLDAMTDDDIDTSEISELDEEWFKNAKVIMPQPKKAISPRIDREVLRWFKSQGKGYQSHINAVLKAYVNAQKARTGQKE
ncbi:BrnA antitoxin family protein [candidate division KSB1 bacterium]|nr:BrnA antitoxin family protein [candidate division KSB1 bacterium]NIR71427.1 BrnA antitoxin family protein [candidate division KSB1 bacterium]NIS23348.1 BrnA antitoxin family protein [candidate division KSB1 bacterium]NIT70239.1 BrnA antitoxin family protein [candidate division KSB1 bacterium]NIU23962.1 BrnA antitoxin family protein [candidate division KSB1 bacterium]